MDRIKAFGAALILLMGFVLAVNGVFIHYPLKADHTAFGNWFNPYKDMSYEALSENMGKDTILLLGSSEFRHGRKSPYHPKNMFQGSDIDLMMVGGALNQTLFHTIAVGSLDKDLHSRKVILLVSPTWFKKAGVSADGYSVRFSETEYIHCMENRKIPKKTKRYIAERTETLLVKHAEQSARARLIGQQLVYKKKDTLTNLLFKTEKFLATGRDRVAAGMAIRTSQLQEPQRQGEDQEAAEKISKKEWKEFRQWAIDESRKHSNNPFDMSDFRWEQKFQRLYRSNRMYNRKINASSPEFDDLKAFLEVCRSCGIEAKLIILPVNGFWFDYIGTTEEMRSETAAKVRRLAEKYGAEAVDLSRHEYDRFITRDATHPWNAGWVLIDEEIYRFSRKK